MSDALRAVRLVPGFLETAEVHLVETSPHLSERQRERLSGGPVPIACRRSRPARQSSSPTSLWTPCRSGNSCAPSAAGASA
jgi:SAM-dependent MidA family methyltransferase